MNTMTALVGVRQISRLLLNCKFEDLTSKIVETKVHNFTETRTCIAYGYRNKFINEQEFAFLCDAHKITNPEFSY